MHRLGVILALISSCGGDDGGGISVEDPLAELEGPEVTELCERLVTTYGSEIDFGSWCTFVVLLAAQAQPEPLEPGDCFFAVFACAQLLENEVLDPKQCADNLDGQLDDCDATVGELEECIGFTLKTTDAVLGGLSCSDAGDAAALEALQEQIANALIDQPPACSALLGCSGIELPGLL